MGISSNYCKPLHLEIFFFKWNVLLANFTFNLKKLLWKSSKDFVLLIKHWPWRVLLIRCSLPWLCWYAVQQTMRGNYLITGSDATVLILSKRSKPWVGCVSAQGGTVHGRTIANINWKVHILCTCIVQLWHLQLLHTDQLEEK